MVGEAPGRVEEVRGYAFCGPAGRLQRHAAQDAAIRAGVHPTIYYTNTVLCRPPNNRDPLEEEAMACWINVSQIIAMVQPELIITIGKIPAKYIGSKVPTQRLVHPSYILRCGGVGSRAYETFVRQMADMFRGLK